MVNTDQLAKEVAEELLKIQAIVINTKKRFTWSSGIESPIYCDNRKILSYPKLRSFIKKKLSEMIQLEIKELDVIAGVATAGIPHGVLVAEALGLPFIYVRSSPKEHGLVNKIEGVVHENENVVVVEDLISTGGSSLDVVETLRDKGCKVTGVAAIFTYGFAVAEERFKEANCPWITLSNYDMLIETAVETGYITSDETSVLKDWRNSIKK